MRNRSTESCRQGARQRKEFMELAFEHLPELLTGTVDADGFHRYMERI